MKNPLTWLIAACVVIGLLVALCIQQGCQRADYKTAEQLQLLYEACLTAPKTSDTVHDTIYIYDTTWLRPKEKVITIHDTTVKYCQAWFEDTYKFTNAAGSGRIHYAINVKDCQAEIQFKEVVSPKEIITVTTHIDTCLPKLVYGTKSHIWLYGKPTVDLSPIKVSAASLGAIYTFKDRWGIGLGAGYNWTISTPVAEAMILFNIR